MSWVRVTPPRRGQLWYEVRIPGRRRRVRPGQGPQDSLRVVRQFVVVDVQGDRVTTADVHQWKWNVGLQAWSGGDGDEAARVRGPLKVIKAEVLRRSKFVLMADPQNVHCDLPVIAPTQGVLLEYSGVPGGMPTAPSWTRCARPTGPGANGVWPGQLVANEVGS